MSFRQWSNIGYKLKVVFICVELSVCVLHAERVAKAALIYAQPANQLDLYLALNGVLKRPFQFNVQGCVDVRELK